MSNFGAETTGEEALKESLHRLPEFIAVLVSFFLISLNWRRRHRFAGFQNTKLYASIFKELGFQKEFSMPYIFSTFPALKILKAQKTA